jgi:hypothetical protein
MIQGWYIDESSQAAQKINPLHLRLLSHRSLEVFQARGDTPQRKRK